MITFMNNSNEMPKYETTQTYIGLQICSAAPANAIQHFIQLLNSILRENSLPSELGCYMQHIICLIEEYDVFLLDLPRLV